MLPAGIKLIIPPSQRQQTHALDSVATGIGQIGQTPFQSESSFNILYNHPRLSTEYIRRYITMGQTKVKRQSSTYSLPWRRTAGLEIQPYSFFNHGAK